METTTPSRAVIDLLGLPEVSKALNMKEGTVKVIVADKRNGGLLPANWFGPLSEVAKAQGASLDRDAFRWRGA